MASDAPARVTFVALRHRHHAARSGYGLLPEYIEGTVIDARGTRGLLQRALRKMLRPVARRSGSRWFHGAHAWAEVRAARRWLQVSGEVFHVLYGENSYRYLGHVKRVHTRNRLLASYHTPGTRFREVVSDARHLQRLDGVIVFTESEADFFAGHLPRDRIFVVPHGVDVEHFRPALQNRGADAPLRCLFVGQHLRDFGVLVGAMRLARDALGAGVTFDLVLPRHAWSRLGPVGEGVRLQSGVSDEALLRLYQRSDLFLFPLLDATGNCALKEAMACGLPVVVTDLPATREYVDAAAGVFVPRSDVAAFALAIIGLARDRERLERMRLDARRCAERFSMERVAAQTRAVYERVLALPPWRP